MELTVKKGKFLIRCLKEDSQAATIEMLKGCGAKS